jgi:hypothetical protein
MVTAMTAEVTRAGVNVKNGQGATVKVIRADLREDSPRGVNLDVGNDLLEEAGYIAGTWRWAGDHYRAVVAPEAVFPRRRLGPAYSDESMAEWRRSPEGREHAAAMGRHRAR